jgi:divalent metal cation (Fe/Co/Zn/Cd) transporter
MTEQRRFSFARLAVFSLGAGALVLAISVPVVIGLAQVSPVAALIVAILALVLAVAVMGIVSNRMVDRAAGDMRSRTDPHTIEGDPNTP